MEKKNDLSKKEVIDQKRFENEVLMCNLWLEEFAEPAEAWSDQSSYYFKHQVEKWFFPASVCNEAFIEAGKQRFEYKLATGSTQNYVFKFKLNKPMKFFRNYDRP